MSTHTIQAAAASTVTARPGSLAVLRAQLTALTFNSPWLSAAEQLRANHHAHECQDAGRISRWLVNTQATIARRTATFQQQCRHQATSSLSAHG